MRIPNIKGLKFPDEYVVRAFFKNGLAQKSGRVIEFGCGNGNNLSLFYQYGWGVVGIDIFEHSIRDANANFAEIAKENANGTYEFTSQDMLQYTPQQKFDAILFPSSLYYVPKANSMAMLARLPGMIADSGACVYFRMRRPNDYRVNISSVEEDGITRRIQGDETGEQGCSMTFIEPDAFIADIRKHCTLMNPVVMQCQFDNIQQGKIISNCDFILWGTITN